MHVFSRVMHFFLWTQYRKISIRGDDTQKSFLGGYKYLNQLER